MSVSVHQVINEARKLVGRLKEYDCETDKLMSDAQTLNRAVETMKEYHEDMSSLSSVSHHKPRSSIILTIQRESKQVRQLENENRELKCALEDHQFALELIMSKYRYQMSHLIKIKNAETRYSHLDDDRSSEILAMQANKIYEMVAVMNKSIQLDEVSHVREQRVLAQLTIENQGLRELLGIARKNGTPGLTGKKEGLDKSVQTDDHDSEEVIKLKQDEEVK